MRVSQIPFLVIFVNSILSPISARINAEPTIVSDEQHAQIDLDKVRIGRRDLGVGAQIVNGKPVSTTDHPEDYLFTVSLQRKAYRSFSHFCGGSLIHPQYVLTAGHCVKYNGPDRVVIGTLDLSKKGIVRKVKRKDVYRHPYYSGVNSDIAILKLNKPVNNVPIISLSEESGGFFEQVGEMLSVVGWGYTKEGSGKVVDDLQIVDVPVVSQRDCSKAYSSIGNSKICAGYSQGGKDSCSGDSGGPLFWKQDRKYVQVGIVSYGRGCARKSYYGVYTRNSHFHSWVEETLWKTGRASLRDMPNVPTPKPTSPTFSREVRFCKRFRNKRKCARKKSRCSWLETESEYDLTPNSCVPNEAIPLEKPDNGDGDDNGDGQGESEGVSEEEMDFCNKKRRPRGCKRVSSRCFWNTRRRKQIVNDYPRRSCLPNGLLRTVQP